VVGINEFQTDETRPVETLRIGPETRERQIQRLEKLRSRRDTRAVKRALSGLQEAARSDKNLLPRVFSLLRVAKHTYYRFGNQPLKLSHDTTKGKLISPDCFFNQLKIFSVRLFHCLLLFALLDKSNHPFIPR